MPTYEYQDSDGNIIEEIFSIKNVPESVEKNGKIYKKIISIPRIIIDAKQPKTIGDLARKNTDRMEKEGKLKKKKEKPLPWWRDNKKVDTDLAKLSGNAATRYIMEGKK